MEMQRSTRSAHANRMTPRIYSAPATAIGAAYVAGYVALDWISYINPFAAFGITPWNPPPGLSFVLVLLFGQRFLPLLFVAPLIADLLVRRLPLPWSVELLAVLVIGGGYALASYALLQPRIRFSPSLDSMRDLLLLLGVAAIASALVAVLYVGLLVAFAVLPATEFLAAAVQFWIGDVIGIAVVAPIALVTLARVRKSGFGWETLAQLVAIGIALTLVFSNAEANHFQLFYLLFLPIVWMAVRGGLEAVAFGNVLTQAGLILGVQLVPASEVNVIAFQALMLVLAVTGLVAGALVDERRNTEIQLRLHQDSLARLARLGSMGELAAAIAHEINQPLSAAGTYARLVADELRQDPSDRSVLAETANKTAAQVERAAEVVRRLRALVRLDRSGRVPLKVDRIIEESVRLAHLDLEGSNVRTIVRIDRDVPAVMADLLQVEHVLINLLRNAAEAIAGTGAGGVVTIAARRTGADVEISVSDTGPGFPLGFAGTELPPLSSTKPEGLGIGLPLARSIVEAHGGRMQIENLRDGAQVRFTLAAAESADD